MSDPYEYDPYANEGSDQEEIPIIRKQKQ